MITGTIVLWTLDELADELEAVEAHLLYSEAPPEITRARAAAALARAIQQVRAGNLRTDGE